MLKAGVVTNFGIGPPAMVVVMLQRDDAGGVAPSLIEPRLPVRVEQLVEIANLIRAEAGSQGNGASPVGHMQRIDLHVAE